MEHKNILILIPSRYHSSRFEGKPLVPINGKSLIKRVYEGCERIKTSNQGKNLLNVDIAVVTDDDRIEKHVKDFDGEVVRVDEKLESGTLRIEKAYKKYFREKKKYDVIINVQGDEPLIDGPDLQNLADFHINSQFSISTIVKPESMSNENIKSSDKVKAIYSKENGKCHFFTRAEVPYIRDQSDASDNNEWFLHIGVYAYSPESLLNYCLLKPSYYEELEKLEQLRALENNMTIGAIITSHEMIGIDTPEDIIKLEGVLSE